MCQLLTQASIEAIVVLSCLSAHISCDHLASYSQFTPPVSHSDVRRVESWLTGGVNWQSWHVDLWCTSMSSCSEVLASCFASTTLCSSSEILSCSADSRASNTRRALTSHTHTHTHTALILLPTSFHAMIISSLWNTYVTSAWVRL